MDIMLDLETLGKKPGSVVLSIGAQVFNINGPMPAPSITFYRNIDLFSSLMIGLTIDQSTVDFWREQDASAQTAFLGAPVTPLLAVQQFAEWFKGLNPTTNEDYAVQVWAKSPTFDCVLWQAVCESVGKEVPWAFRAPRDVRTLFALAEFDEKSITSKGTGRVKHNALDDCNLQIMQVQAAWAKLKATPRHPAVPLAMPGMPPQVPSFARED